MIVAMMRTGSRYISVVSIIFYCSMPILYNFHILLATFYIIFGTNNPVPSASSCLFHVFRFAENPYQMDSKRDKNQRRLFWNICDFWEEKSTRDDARGGHEAGGTPQGGGRAPDPRGHPIRRLVPFFSRKKANIQIKIVFKFQSNRSYRSLGI